jgi:hypothetical protein
MLKTTLTLICIITFPTISHYGMEHRNPQEKNGQNPVMAQLTEIQPLIDNQQTEILIMTFLMFSHSGTFQMDAQNAILRDLVKKQVKEIYSCIDKNNKKLLQEIQGSMDKEKTKILEGVTHLINSSTSDILRVSRDQNDFNLDYRFDTMTKNNKIIEQIEALRQQNEQIINLLKLLFGSLCLYILLPTLLSFFNRSNFVYELSYIAVVLS